MDTLPGSDSKGSREGRLSNVSAVVTVGPDVADGSVTDLRALLERICEDVVVQRIGPDDSPLATLVAALEVSRAERVLVVAANAPAIPAELVLALVAWPQRAIVHAGGSWGSAIYLRESVLPAAREGLAGGDTQVAALTAALDVDELDGEALATVSGAG